MKYSIHLSCWLVCLLLAACQPAVTDTSTSIHPISPTALPAKVSVKHSPVTPAVPRYAGTYAVQDTAVCDLSITIERQKTKYTFLCSTGAKGPLHIARDSSGTFFTFVGLKGEEPEEDIGMLWQDSVLLMQNYGNSMNNYTRFGWRDAKYLELHRE